MQCLGLLILVFSFTFGKELIIENRRRDTIWVGTLSNPGKALLNHGGFRLDAGQQVRIDAPEDWAGRFWARTGCNFGRERCDTGDCGGINEHCNGRGGEPPATLAEFTFNGWKGQDYYDVSLVDGFNIPIKIIPTNPTKDDNPYWCAQAVCLVDLNERCPEELRLKNRELRIVGCKSACLAFNDDRYCCRGAHNKPETCKSTDWPKNYPKYFKDNCPDAYSYAYDDHKSTFTCRNTGYKIEFF